MAIEKIYPHALGLEDIKKAIMICLSANVPTILWGPPGFVKSAIFKFLRELLNAPIPEPDNHWLFYDLRTSDKEPTDMGGFPVPVHRDKQIQYYVNNALPWASIVDERQVMFIMDEIDRARDQAMVNVNLQVLLDREVNGQKLGPNVRILAAANGESSKGTIKLNEAALARCAHLYIDPGHMDNLASFSDWSDNPDNGVSAGLSQLMSMDSEQWSDFGTSEDRAIRQDPAMNRRNPGQIEDKAFACPRTKVNADKILQKANAATFEVSPYLRLCLAQSCVGKTRAPDFLAKYDFLTSYDLREMVKNPASFEIPTKSEDLTTLANILGKYITLNGNDPEFVDKISILMDRLPPEIASTTIRTVQTNDPILAGKIKGIHG